MIDRVVEDRVPPGVVLADTAYGSCSQFRAHLHEAVRQAASVDSLARSGYQLGRAPWAPFRDVLPKLGDTGFPASRLVELLPEAWAQPR